MLEISTKNQEEISICYFSAIAAKSNTTFNINRRDEDSSDATVTKTILLSDGTKVFASLFFQIKSVYSKRNYFWNRDGNLVYKLNVKNYRDLITPSATPRFLVVMILPENNEDWVNVTIDQMILKKCMYYVSLSGLSPTESQSTVDVVLPKENIFNCNSLENLLLKSMEE